MYTPKLKSIHLVLVTKCIVRQKPVLFRNRGLDLYGVLHLPPHEKGRKVPAVILCHGFSGTKSEAHRLFVKMARILADCGIAALRFDFRGTGDSEGDFEDMTVAGEISDTRKAVDWITSAGKREGIDATRIGLLGLSLGGMVAACTAGRDKRIKAVALWGAVSDLKASVRHLRRDRKDIIRSLPDGKIDYAGNVITKKFLTEGGRLRPCREIQKLQGPVLIVHGTRDNTEPPRSAKAYYKALKGRDPGTRLLFVEGADHTFSSIAWENQVFTATTEFCKKALQ